MFTIDKIERLPIIQRGELIIDSQGCKVKLSGKEIELYPKEYDILLFWRGIQTVYFQ